MTTEKLKCEKVRLPMVCVCDKKQDDGTYVGERHAAADALRDEAKALLSWEDSPCTDANFTTRAIGHLYWSYEADVEFACDQWFGVYATIKKHVECEHSDDECPDEPECFVYRWDPVLRVTAECDRVEDGLASIIKWFHENRSVQAA